jgi:hypothetical protein
MRLVLAREKSFLGEGCLGGFDLVRLCRSARQVAHAPRIVAERSIVAALRGAVSYMWRLALAATPTVYLQQKQTSGSRVTFSGLAVGQVYVVDASALGAAGQSDYSMAANGLMVV